MSFRDQLHKIQNQPYETRVKILWVTVIVVAIILLATWIFGLKNTLNGVDAKKLIQTPTPNSTSATRDDLVVVEWTEKSVNSFKIYFNIDNQTDDILNISKLNDIRLQFEDQDISPVQVTDRQGKAFVVKALSKSKNFGILTFDIHVDDPEAILTFDNLFFEKNPSLIYRQELKLDLTKLNEDGKLRD